MVRHCAKGFPYLIFTSFQIFLYSLSTLPKLDFTCLFQLHFLCFNINSALMGLCLISVSTPILCPKCHSQYPWLIVSPSLNGPTSFAHSINLSLQGFYQQLYVPSMYYSLFLSYIIIQLLANLFSGRLSGHIEYQCVRCSLISPFSLGSSSPSRPDFYISQWIG